VVRRPYVDAALGASPDVRRRRGAVPRYNE
jgi:hypothetical protein